MYIPSVPERPSYLADFEALGFGIFVHYGLYSQLGRGEWAYWMGDRDMNRYKKLFDSFTAENFDAERICACAARAGAKYVNLTTRHHDGFSLYDTCGLSDYDAPHSPAGRDLVREFCDACSKYGLVPFLYHTTLDWYQSSFNENFDAYLGYLKDSVEILCKNYGKIGGFFFDGNWIKPKADWREDELYGMIRRYQPDAVIINNTGLHARGRAGSEYLDVVTFEQGNVRKIDRDGAKRYYAGEVCMTMNTHWGHAENDFNYKSPAELIKTLCECREAGSNFLLNISPGKDGSLSGYQEAALGVVGDWMRINGAAVYNGRPTVYPDEIGSASGVGTMISEDKKTLYFICYQLGKIGDTNVTVDGKYSGAVGFGNVNCKIKEIRWLDNGCPLEFTQGEGMLSVKFTGYEYGSDLCVRIAAADIERDG